MIKILICTRGSLGDVLPYISLAQNLERNGYKVLMLVNASNLGVVTKVGLECKAFDIVQHAQVHSNSAALKGVSQSLLGGFKLLRNHGKYLRQEVEYIQNLAPDFDLIISSQTSLAAPLVARALGKPWVFSGVSPAAFISFIDPPYLYGLRWLSKDSLLPGWWKSVLQWYFLKVTDLIYKDYREIEKELDLPHQHPLFFGRYSPWLNLALFSPLLAQSQLDWPEQTIQCGFVNDAIYPVNQVHDAALARFLESGPAPVVFTLGSVSRVELQDFCVLALKVIGKLGVRAVFVKRDSVQLNVDPSLLIHVCGAVNYKLLFSSCQCVVHDGGVATLTQAISAGKISLILPKTLDQFDQAARAKKLGVAEVLPFQNLSEDKLLAGVLHILYDINKTNATLIRAVKPYNEENGIRVACNQIDRLIGSISNLPRTNIEEALFRGHKTSLESTFKLVQKSEVDLMVCTSKTQAAAIMQEELDKQVARLFASTRSKFSFKHGDDKIPVMF